MPLPVAWQISVLALQPLVVPGSQVTQAPPTHTPPTQSALTVQAGTHWPKRQVHPFGHCSPLQMLGTQVLLLQDQPSGHWSLLLQVSMTQVPLKQDQSSGHSSSSVQTSSAHCPFPSSVGQHFSPATTLQPLSLPTSQIRHVPPTHMPLGHSLSPVQVSGRQIPLTQDQPFGHSLLSLQMSGTQLPSTQDQSSGHSLLLLQVSGTQVSPRHTQPFGHWGPFTSSQVLGTQVLSTQDQPPGHSLLLLQVSTTQRPFRQDQPCGHSLPLGHSSMMHWPLPSLVGQHFSSDAQPLLLPTSQFTQVLSAEQIIPFGHWPPPLQKSITQVSFTHVHPSGHLSPFTPQRLGTQVLSTQAQPSGHWSLLLQVSMTQVLFRHDQPLGHWLLSVQSLGAHCPCPSCVGQHFSSGSQPLSLITSQTTHFPSVEQMKLPGHSSSLSGVQVSGRQTLLMQDQPLGQYLSSLQLLGTHTPT